ncbi:hypothetical protein [Actinoplanes sp. NPDC049599]|uniref:hypothetical protein n=1 Tax=Actinoplanes sp. NPDC049599 TaxID=3363903 RepID=UPI0037A6BF08
MLFAEVRQHGRHPAVDDPAVLSVPWLPLAGAAAACAVIVVTAAVATAARHTRS